VRLGLEELNLGEEAILLGKIGEAGASEPFSCCYILCQLRERVSTYSLSYRIRFFPD